MVRQLVERGEMWPTQRQYVAFSEAKCDPHSKGDWSDIKSEAKSGPHSRATGATSCEVFGKKRLELVKF